MQAGSCDSLRDVRQSCCAGRFGYHGISVDNRGHCFPDTQIRIDVFQTE